MGRPGARCGARARPTLGRLRPIRARRRQAEEVDPHGRLALSAAVHRFSAANGHVVAAFGLTPRYMREPNRGFSTFEFQLAFEHGVRAGDPFAGAQRR